MALIEQGSSSMGKIPRKKLVRERTSSTEDYLKTLSFNVYSSRHLIATTKQQRSDLLVLPSIDKDENRYRQKTKPPSYRQSRYHTNTSNSHRTNLPVIIVQQKRPDLSTRQQDDTVLNRQHQRTPPPTPSEYQLEHILVELNRTQESTPYSSSRNNDGYIPYRLPALRQSSKQRYTDKTSSPTPVRSILTNYYQTLYSKY